MPLKPFRDMLAQGMFQTNKNISGKTNPLGQNTPNSMTQPYQKRNFGDNNVPYIDKGQGIIGGGGTGGVFDPGDWGGEGIPEGEGNIAPPPFGGGGTGGGTGGGETDPDPPYEWTPEQIELWSSIFGTGANPDSGWLQQGWGEYIGEGGYVTNNLLDDVSDMIINENLSYDDIINMLQGSYGFTSEGGFPEQEDPSLPPIVNWGQNLQTTPVSEQEYPTFEGQMKPGKPFLQARKGRGMYDFQGIGKQSGLAAKGSFMDSFLKEQEREEEI